MTTKPQASKSRNVDIFETLSDILKPDDNPFGVKNTEFIKAENPANCKAKYHNFGVRKYGFCANCNGTDLIYGYEIQP